MELTQPVDMKRCLCDVYISTRALELHAMLLPSNHNRFLIINFRGETPLETLIFKICVWWCRGARRKGLIKRFDHEQSTHILDLNPPLVRISTQTRGGV